MARSVSFKPKEGVGLNGQRGVGFRGLEGQLRFYPDQAGGPGRQGVLAPLTREVLRQGFRCDQAAAGGRSEAEGQGRVHGGGARQAVRQEKAESCQLGIAPIHYNLATLEHHPALTSKFLVI